jgi:hypothetical protein
VKPSDLTPYFRQSRFFWLLVFLLGCLLAINNSLTTSDDLQRNQVMFKPWEPHVWEWTSFVVIFALYGAVAWLARRHPLFTRHWFKGLLIHVLGSVVFSVTHVLLMVLLRQGIYLLAGAQYDFGDWSGELLYEYRKDLFTYFSFLLVYGLWQHWLASAPSTPQPISGRLKISNKQGNHLVPFCDIISIESGGNYVYVHTASQVLPMRGTMKSILEWLDPQHFIRVHRSFIINKQCISRLTDLANDPCTLEMLNGKKVPVSRTHRAAVQAVIDQASVAHDKLKP